MEVDIEHHLIYEMVGGEDTFFELVDNFYAMVAHDELLLPMYPEKLEMAKKKLALFLIQKFGGPDEYTPLRGHPRMRRRHMKFKIGSKERNRWVEIMSKAMDETGITEDHEARSTLQSYFEWMASHMVNQSEFAISLK